MGNSNKEKSHDRSFNPPTEQDLEVGDNRSPQKDQPRSENKQVTPNSLDQTYEKPHQITNTMNHQLVVEVMQNSKGRKEINRDMDIN